MATQLICVVCDVPVLVPLYSPCQLYILGLECHPPGVYGQPLGEWPCRSLLLPRGHQLPLGPAQGVLCHLLLLQLTLHQIRSHGLCIPVLLSFPVCNLPHEPAIKYTVLYMYVFRPFWHELTLWLLQYYNYHMNGSLEMQRFFIYIRLYISLRVWVPDFHFLVLWRGWW